MLPSQEADPRVFWHPPKIWTGGTAFIIGGGPSLKNFDWGLISSEKIIGINDAYRLGPFIDFNCFGDTAWYRKHQGDLKYATATIVGITAQPLLKKNHSSVKWMRRQQRHYTDAPGEIGWYNNTGMSGICLAIQLGATKIRLLGFDMKLDGETGENNWHINKINSPNAGVYPRFMAGGRKLKNQLDELHPEVEILNCNPDSAMDVWPKVRLEDVL